MMRSVTCETNTAVVSETVTEASQQAILQQQTRLPTTEEVQARANNIREVYRQLDELYVDLPGTEIKVTNEIEANNGTAITNKDDCKEEAGPNMSTSAQTEKKNETSESTTNESINPLYPEDQIELITDYERGSRISG